MYNDRCSGAGPHLFNGYLQLFLVLVGAQVGCNETASVEVIFSPFFFTSRNLPLMHAKGRARFFEFFSERFRG